MVEVKFGDRTAYLRVASANSIYVCDKTGLPLKSGISAESFDYLLQALDWLASRWRVKDMEIYYDSEDKDNYGWVDGSQRLKCSPPTKGEITEKEEIDWLMFNRRKIVFNSVDGQLWIVNYENSYSRSISGPSLPVVPSHRPIYTARWSVPQFPDKYYTAFESDLKKKHSDAEIQMESKLGHFKVARLMKGTLSRKVPVVAVEKDASLGKYRITNLLGEEQERLLFRSDENGFENHGDEKCCWQIVRELSEKHLETSWKSFFPKEWDVVAVSRREFYEHTFAGHCYQTQNFVGMQNVPHGYLIAWENRYDDMLLIRLGANGTVRCPSEFKGKVIGTGGGNIKGIAKKFGHDHWNLKLV